VCKIIAFFNKYVIITFIFVIHKLINLNMILSYFIWYNIIYKGCKNMPENCKLKYLEICQNEDLVYEIIDRWNILLNKNIFNSKEEKIEKLEQVKNIDFELYKAMRDDINAELY